MAVLLYLALGLILLYFLLRRTTRKYKQIPGPKGLPLVGYGPFMKNKNEHEIFSDFAEQYGDIFKLNVYGQTTVVLNSARLIRTAFNGDKYKHFLNDRATTFYGEFVYAGSKAITFITKAYDSELNDLRKAFTKGMHFNGEGSGAFEDNVRDELMNVVERIQIHKGEPFDMVEIFTRSLTNFISVFLSGHDLKDDDKDVNLFWDFMFWDDYFLGVDVNLVLTSFSFLRFMPGAYKTPYQKVQQAKETIARRFFYEKKASYKEGEMRGIVDFMIREQLESQKNGRNVLFTDERIIVLILEIVAAGMLNTLSSLSSIILCLMNYPEYQTKIQAELDKVVGTERLPSVTDRNSCVFIEATLMEIQRYISIKPTMIPHYCRNGIEFEGFEIPPNSLVFPNAWYVHHNTDIWGDPWTFRPERWLDETGSLLPSDHILRKNWLPFGNGRRQCPGEGLARSRIFLYVATLLQRWSFEMLSDQAVSCDPRHDTFNAELTIRPKPFKCRALPRQ